jgi:hypothetical protein
MAGADRQRRPLPGSQRTGQLARVESPQAAQVVAAAGSAIVGAAKVGRLLTRTGWGLARRLPGGQALQREVQRLQDAALNEMRRMLDIPDAVSAAGMTGEEQRAVLLIQNTAHSGAEPLRAAMSELLERSVEPNREASREYLFGSRRRRAGLRTWPRTGRARQRLDSRPQCRCRVPRQRADLPHPIAQLRTDRIRAT